MFKIHGTEQDGSVILFWCLDNICFTEWKLILTMPVSKTEGIDALMLMLSYESERALNTTKVCDGSWITTLLQCRITDIILHSFIYVHKLKYSVVEEIIYC